MTMHIVEGATLAVAAIAGAMLGAVFFGGLWWTVQWGATSPRAGLWFSASFLLRTAVTLGGVYAVGAGHWPSLIACLAGFLTARLIVLRLSRVSAPAASNAS